MHETQQKYDRKSGAKYCGVSVVTIDRALAGEKISHFRIGRRIVFDRAHLDEFLASCQKIRRSMNEK